MRSKAPPILLLIFSVTQLLVACGGGSGTNSEVRAGDNGSIHIEPFLDNGCIACHMEGEVDQPLGPSLFGVATRSEATIKDPAYTGNAATVEEYIRESILQPEIYVVDGFTPLMPKTYASSLEETELEMLVDYLLTLE